MINNLNQIYPDVIPRNTVANAIGKGVLTAGFKTIQATILASLIEITYSSETLPFIVGEVITANTGGTGIVISDNNTNTLVVRVTAGVWTGATSATGTTSGAVATITAVTFPNFDIGFIKSDQEYVPDPNLPVSPTNLYSPVGYTDESTGVFYAYTFSVNPATNQGFAINVNVETAGSRWMFVTITNYSSGTVEKVDLETFSA